MRALRIVIGLPLAAFALAYLVIGSMFMTGAPPYDSGPGTVLALGGLLGLCGPVMLFGLHLALSGPDAPVRLRTVLFAGLVMTLVAGIAGCAYGFGRPELQSEAANMLVSVLVSAILFGGAIVHARFFAPGR